VSTLTKAMGLLIGLLFLSLSATAGTHYEDVNAWLFETYQLDREVYEIEHLTDRLFELDDAAELTIVRPLSQKDPIGLYTVLAQVDHADGRSESMQVRMRIRKFADVVVAKDKFDRHDLLDPTALTVERADITTIREQPVRSINELDGLRTTRIVRRGTILTAGLVESIPDIEPGAEVEIIVQSGLCTITARGKALESGYKGDLVKVKNAASGKIIHAEVIDNVSVAVNP